MKIPNLEIEKVFVSDVISKARRYTGHGESDDFSRAITLRNPSAFRDAIQRFLTEIVSYFDIALTPLIENFPGVIIEVKAAKTARQNLKKLALEARDQIDEKDYAAEMTAEGVTDILKFGLAYYKKRVELAR